MPSRTLTPVRPQDTQLPAPDKALFPICAHGGRRQNRIRAAVKSPSLALLAVLPVGGAK